MSDHWTLHTDPSDIARIARSRAKRYKCEKCRKQVKILRHYNCVTVGGLLPVSKFCCA